MANDNRGNRPSQEMITEGYKQVRINARLTALQAADSVLKMRCGAADFKPSAQMLLDDAKLIEDYIMKDITPPTMGVRPSIVPVKSFP